MDNADSTDGLAQPASLRDMEAARRRWADDYGADISQVSPSQAFTDGWEACLRALFAGEVE